VSPLPERASVWGSLFFGLDSGDRLDLVQMLQLLPIAIEDFKPDRVEELAPDYLLVSSYETDNDFVRYLAGFRTIEGLSTLFPHVHYKLGHVVYALPYGGARVYEHHDTGVPVRPSVSVTDGSSAQWSRQVGEPLPASFAPAAPVVASVSLYGMAPRRRALTSQVADLPPGFYAIEVALDRPAMSHFGYVLASSGPAFYWRGGWTNFSIPAAPYFGDENSVLLLVDHLGGPLYLSRFENAPEMPTDSVTDRQKLLADLRGRSVPRPRDPVDPDRYGMHVLTVRPVAVPRHATDRVSSIVVPGWNQWSVQTNGVDATVRSDGRVALKGSAAPFAYVFESPWIDVPSKSRVAVAVPTETFSGSIEVGVLGPDGEWITAPTMMPRRLAFDSGAFTRVRLVFANGGLGRDLPFDVAAALPQLSPVAPKDLYVDRLMACRSPYIPHSSDCAR
jgi:hypothetical protein